MNNLMKPIKNFKPETIAEIEEKKRQNYAVPAPQLKSLKKLYT